MEARKEVCEPWTKRRLAEQPAEPGLAGLPSSSELGAAEIEMNLSMATTNGTARPWPVPIIEEINTQEAKRARQP